jgi:hypothetical protein
LGDPYVDRRIMLKNFSVKVWIQFCSCEGTFFDWLKWLASSEEGLCSMKLVGAK